MRLLIVGSGYVGLVSTACFAELGHQVICIDQNAEKIGRLKKGIIPIFEPGLSEMIQRNLANGRIVFKAGMPRFGDSIDAVFIAVGTPPRGSDQQADLSAVYSVAKDVAANAGSRVVIVTKSTVPVGTGDVIERMVGQARPDLKFSVVSNPEFLREGSAIKDFLEPDRIVVGSECSYGQRTLSEIYASLAQRGARIVHTRRRAAEIIKYAANAFLATKISFINEIADLCEAAKVDVGDVATGIGLDRRIGSEFLNPGPGYGGSCFPKDTAALLATAGDFAVNLRIVESTVAVNVARKRSMARRVINAMGGNVHGCTVAVLGLTFKADTDDVREAPAIGIINSLQQAGALVRAYDPQGMENASEFVLDVIYAKDAYECVEGADCVVLTTAWGEFRLLSLNRLACAMKGRVFVDLRNAFHPTELTKAGFLAFGIGTYAVRATQPDSINGALDRPNVAADRRSGVRDRRSAGPNNWSGLERRKAGHDRRSGGPERRTRFADQMVASHGSEHSATVN